MFCTTQPESVHVRRRRVREIKNRNQRPEKTVYNPLEEREIKGLKGKGKFERRVGVERVWGETVEVVERKGELSGVLSS